jgi:hypothetical protein
LSARDTIEAPLKRKFQVKVGLPTSGNILERLFHEEDVA